MNDENVAFVKKAYELARDAHIEQFRSSGEPYIIHPVQVAGILAELQMDPETVAAGFYMMLSKIRILRGMIWYVNLAKR